VWDRLLIPLCITFEVLTGFWVLNPSDTMSYRPNHGVCQAEVLKADGSPDLMWCEDGAWKIEGKKWKWAGPLTPGSAHPQG